MRLLCFTLLVSLVLASSSVASSCASYIPDLYDKEIERAAEKWWPPEISWYWWKAQLYQESRLDPNAVSPVGAQGIAQFMPGTWKQMQQALDLQIYAPTVAKVAIETGAYYMRKLASEWQAKRPLIDKWDLGRASYNAGLGNLLKAQRACNGASLYADIVKCLPKVTGHHSKETKTYVKRIHRYYGDLSCS